MQALAALCVRRPVFASVLILSLVVVGSYALTRLGVDLMPNIDIPTITVTTRLPGGTASTGSCRCCHERSSNPRSRNRIPTRSRSSRWR